MMNMERSEILKLYNDFSSEFDIDGEKNIWDAKSKEFRDFWKDKILNDKVKELNPSEVDEIIRILDKNGKGNKPGDHSVAKCMIRQDIWRKMFNDIKKEPKIKDLLDKIFNATDDEALVRWLDELNDANMGKRNGLTGDKGNAINTMLFAYTPTEYISVVSLDDRESIIKTFNFESGPDFDEDSWGRKIVASNRAIIEGFRTLGIDSGPRVISQFLYRNLKQYWKPDIENAKLSSLNTTAMDEVSGQNSEIDTTTFVMEKHLEDFLIENWENTDFGKKYELINDDEGEVVSQQYHTDVGSIDILVKDKSKGNYVVIELKRNQTSDDTVGQVLRYMGWVSQKFGDNNVRGLIIAGQYDKKLDYALKTIKNVDVILYEIDFKFKDFKGDIN